jgi:hypothetical protein
MLQFLLKGLSFSKSLVPNLEMLSLMVGSYPLQIDLCSGRRGIGSDHGSTSARVSRDLEDHGNNGHENANRESHGPHSWVPLYHRHLR